MEKKCHRRGKLLKQKMSGMMGFGRLIFFIWTKNERQQSWKPKTDVKKPNASHL